MDFLKKPLALSALSGLLLAMSWPTYGFPLLIFVAFVPLLFAEFKLRQTARKVKLKIWANAYLTFLLWNLITTWWLFYASAVGMLFAVLVNSLLMSVLFVAYHVVAKRMPRFWALAFFVALWISFERFHLGWDFSWPWLNLGHVFADYPQWIQWYEYTGSFGGSLWVLLVNAFVFHTAMATADHSARNVFQNVFPRFVAFVSIPIVVSLWIYHTYEIQGLTKEVVVLQPNVDPYTEKYDTPNLETTRGLLAQADAVVSPETEFIIAPETVLAESAPFDHFYYSPGFQMMKNYLAKHPKAELLWGIDTYRFVLDSANVQPSSNLYRPGVWVDFYNAALFVNHKPDFQKYYKSKLVVGIENLPYKTVLEPLLGNFMLDLGGTISTKTTQPDRTPFLSDDGTKVAPIICYESVYGEYVTGFVNNGADFLAIITNDAWWNETQGHKQHLTFATLRAIETRRDIARSANTGISAFIDQKGDIVSRTQYNEKTALRGRVHLNKNLTFYVRYGDYIARAAIATLFVLLLVVVLKNRKVRY
ncbi:apolipoprotein N-acyltransferase [Flavobacterium caeni]|uniref:Apolipoprotein N-acyltransferase n=1 Tax=Flavobacterium caeni TaxID=490189 RepID=A0A1G5FNS6_9FLAO|nr:apolipoprotein N-acyltransferase [Flavobacterium caeni]SCY40248.1 apolipoprotein N-acyltransferase [Flavobacterium caeni]